MVEHCLFSYFLLVKLLAPDGASHEDGEEEVVPQLVSVFSAHPGESKAEYLADVPFFCYPEEDLRSLKVSKGKSRSQIFGFCERILPGGSDDNEKRYPECYCILSKYPYFKLFTAILSIIEAVPSLEEQAYPILKDIAAIYPFPKPGETFKISVSLPFDSNPKVFSFTRPHEDMQVFHTGDFAPLFAVLRVHQVLALFSSLLMERRVLFLSKSVSQLSGVIHACHALLYPLSWQHIFIPLLPKHLTHFIAAPIPFVIGLHTTGSEEEIKKYPVSDIEVIDLNKKELTFSNQDWIMMPKDLWNGLNMSLKRIIAKARSRQRIFCFKIANCLPSEQRVLENRLVADHFRAFFVNILWRYRDYMVLTGTDIEFDKKGFIEGAPRQHVEFLQNFLHLQMFDGFIFEREEAALAKTLITSLFERDVTAKRRLRKPLSGIKNIGNQFSISSVRRIGDATKEISTKMYDGAKKIYDEQVDKISGSEPEINMMDFNFLKSKEGADGDTKFGILHEKLHEEQVKALGTDNQRPKSKNAVEEEEFDFLGSGTVSPGGGSGVPIQLQPMDEPDFDLLSGAPSVEVKGQSISDPEGGEDMLGMDISADSTSQDDEDLLTPKSAEGEESPQNVEPSVIELAKPQEEAEILPIERLDVNEEKEIDTDDIVQDMAAEAQPENRKEEDGDFLNFDSWSIGLEESTGSSEGRVNKTDTRAGGDDLASMLSSGVDDSLQFDPLSESNKYEVDEKLIEF